MARQAKIDFSDCTTFLSLSNQEKTFCLEYLKEFNTTKAAQKAKIGGKAAAQAGSRLLKSVKIRKSLAEISLAIAKQGEIQDNIASIQEIAEFLTRTMRGSITDVVNWNDQGLVFVDDSKDLDRNTARLIKKVKVTEKSSRDGDWTECKTEVELHDPVKAAETLGRYHGMFKDKTDVNVTGEVTVKWE